MEWSIENNVAKILWLEKEGILAILYKDDFHWVIHVGSFTPAAEGCSRDIATAERALRNELISIRARRRINQGSYPPGVPKTK